MQTPCDPDRVRIIDVVAGNPPTFTAADGERRFIIALDGSAVMKLCGGDSLDYWVDHLTPQLDRIADAADRVLRERGRREALARLTVSALDLD